jgi:hypothetical protein
VNQIEVTRTRNEGFDEYDRHTPENIQALRAAFAAGWPGAPMTWALSWRALEDSRPNYQAARRLVREFHDQYGDGDGSISYPYYPSTEHFCKPAQGRKDFIDCVNLDGWTMDFISARRLGLGKYKVGEKEQGYNSRFGVGPIETIGWYGPDNGLQQMLSCTAAHFDAGYQLNQWAWVTNCWEISLVPQVKNLPVLTRWLEGIRSRWPNAECLTQGDFGNLWRRHHPDNAHLDYRFVQRGTGFGCSDANLEIRWFMNRQFRLTISSTTCAWGRSESLIKPSHD